MQNFVGKTKCIVGYMKVADSQSILLNIDEFGFQLEVAVQVA